MPRKFFQIGFNKCGTTSIARFFKRNGFRCANWECGKLARRLRQNLQENRFILSGYEHYHAYTDMEHVTAQDFCYGFMYYRQIFEQVEDAMFILNTRDKDNWVRSRLNHHIHGTNESYAACYQAFYGLVDISAVIERWRKEWDAHHAAVQEFIPPERLLVFNIETDSPLRLCEFAGLDDSAAQHYGHENITFTEFGEFLRKRTPGIIKRAMPRRSRDAIKRLLRKRQ